MNNILQELKEIANKRKLEAIQARIKMEKKNVFGNRKKDLRITVPCEACGNYDSFFISEANKVCNTCLKEGITKEVALKNRIDVELNLFRKSKGGLK